MIAKLQVDMIIGILNSLLAALLALDPALQNNKVIAELQNVIAALQALGL